MFLTNDIGEGVSDMVLRFEECEAGEAKLNFSFIGSRIDLLCVVWFLGGFIIEPSRSFSLSEFGVVLTLLRNLAPV